MRACDADIDAAFGDDSTDGPSPTDTEAPPHRSSRPVPFASIFGAAVLGQAVGILAGALVGLAVAGGVGCQDDEGWLGGYTCFAGFGYAGSLGGMLGAPLGTILGTVFAGDAAHVRGSPELAIGGALVGWGLAGIPTLLTYVNTYETSASFLAAYAVGLIASPFLATVLFRDEARVVDVALAPYASPRADGAEAGLTGRF